MVTARLERLQRVQHPGVKPEVGSQFYANPDDLFNKMRSLGSKAVSVKKVKCP